MPPPSIGVAQLVVLAPDAYRGRRIELLKRDTVIGRAESCDVCLDDPYLSRAHAVLRLRGDAVYVEDLGSSAGTSLNGAAVTRARELHSGDLVTLADVRLRFEATDASPAGGSVRYDIAGQHGGVISNVGRDQYNSYVQQVTQQRESFMREVAATKTKARWLVWIGLLCFVAGFALFAAPVLGFISQIAEDLETLDTTPPEDIFGPDILGVPSALVGWALTMVGALLIGVGIVLHIVAASRRKRADRELTVQPPWLAPGQ
jgi:hypothetical protein